MALAADDRPHADGMNGFLCPVSEMSSKYVAVLTFVMLAALALGSGCRMCPTIACGDTYTLNINGPDGSPVSDFEGMVNGESFECLAGAGGSDQPPSGFKCQEGGLFSTSFVDGETFSYQIASEISGTTHTASGEATIDLTVDEEASDSCTTCESDQETITLTAD